jgi:MFS family permease
MRRTFRSLEGYNYRVWAAGALVSNIGTWMQRTAQDWIVLTELTLHDATSVGIVMALQFGPQFVLLPFTGWAADHFERRKILLATQTTQGLLALFLGLLTVTGHVQLWHVYAFALMLGCVSAFDAPARQTFVGQLVGDAHLANAVALNSTSFNMARMVGPAAAGLLIGTIGTGPVFLLNAVSFGAVLWAMALLRKDEIHPRGGKPGARKAGLADGLRYAWARPDLRAVLLMAFLIGTFGINFPIYISSMSVSVFHVGASQFGLLTSAMAVGSVTGALLSAGREQPRMGFLYVASAAFGTALAVAAVMPGYHAFAVALFFVGLATQSFTTTAHGAAQMWTDGALRGRVMAIMMAVGVGGTMLGAPLAGHIADTWGPRWSLGFGALSGFAALLVGMAITRRWWPRLRRASA